MDSPIYTGSRLFLPISHLVGVSVDQLNYVILQFAAVIFGFIFRTIFSHSRAAPTWRYLYCLFVGTGMLFFIIGWESWKVFLQLIVCYILLRYFKSPHMPVVVFFYALGHMLFLYYLRLYLPFEQLCYDTTFPLMITTQKVTTLAFSIGDWQLIHKKGRKIQEEREKWAMRDVPSLLEFFAFCLSFQGILAGPFCHFLMYQSFIHGRDPRKEENVRIPVLYSDHPGSCVKAVMSKLAAVCFWIILTVTLRPIFPCETSVDPEFIANNNMLYRIIFLYISLFLQRSFYYVTWTIADAIYNASGLGYSGLDATGRHTWTLMTNTKIWKIETSTSLKVYLDNWNILTTHWLRHVCYMRVPFLRVYLTFILSALWHGLFAGYYITFVSAAICIEAGRKIRANIRPLFQQSQMSRNVYEVITFFGTQLAIVFLVISFIILDWRPVLRFHSSFYWLFYVFLAMFLLLPSKKSQSKTEEGRQIVYTSNDNGVELTNGVRYDSSSSPTYEREKVTDNDESKDSNS